MESANNTTSAVMHISPWTISPFVEQAIVVPILFTLIFITGLLGNSTLIYIIARYKQFHNAPNLMIMSLAIGDWLLIAFGVPFISTVYTFIAWPYGLALCKIREFLRTMSMGVSIFTLTALSEERYVAIVHPLSIKSKSHMRRTLVITSSVWVLSLGIATLDAVASRLEIEYTSICTTTPAAWGFVYRKAFPMFQFIVFFAIPVLIIGIFYVLMAYSLWTSGNALPGNTTAQATNQQQSRKHVAKVILCFVIIFVVCWFPRHIYQLWWYYDDSEFTDFWMVFKTVGFCLSYVNSCVNPIALYILSQQFRRLFHKHLFCWCPLPPTLSTGAEYATPVSQQNRTADLR